MADQHSCHNDGGLTSLKGFLTKSPSSVYSQCESAMAAATAAQHGASVLLLEKNSVLGKKLSITGGGRCNVTNNKPVVREMLEQYKSDGKFLFSTFSYQFSRLF